MDDIGYLAQQISGARLVDFPASTTTPGWGRDQVSEAVEEFVARLHNPDRAMRA